MQNQIQPVPGQKTEEQTPLPAVCLYSIALSLTDITKELRASRKIQTATLRLAKQNVRRRNIGVIPAKKGLFNWLRRAFITDKRRVLGID